MKLRVLGPYGGEAPGAFLNCFLVDDTVLLDAGSVCQVLDANEQGRIRHVLLSHAHLDHIGSLPHMAVSVFGQDAEPVQIHGSKECMDTLSQHVLNNQVWPDFTKINRPNGKKVYQLNVLESEKDNVIDDLVVKPVPVKHTAPTTGFIVSRGGRSLAYSADTGSTDKFWAEVAAAKGLGGLIVDVSFPNSLANLAEMTGHLTPASMAQELGKIGKALDIPIIVFGVKPEHEKEIRKELKELRIKGLEFPKSGKVYEL